MKKIFTTMLLALPFIGSAQQEEQPTQHKLSTTEISLTTGFALRSDYYDGHRTLGYTIPANASVLHNFRHIQVGIAVNVNYTIDNYYELQPHLLLNKPFATKFGYLYLGGMLGYTSRKHIEYDLYLPTLYEKLRGYVMGLQAGMTINLTKHLAINSELAIHSVQYQGYRLSLPNDYGQGPSQTYKYGYSFFETSVPLKVGLRYRF